MSALRERIYQFLSGVREGERGHGPLSDASDGWTDNKPYVGYWHQGLFEGYDGSLWLYHEFPESVQVRWLVDDYKRIENQSFFVDVMRELADKFSGQEDRLKSDLRREFHVQSTQETVRGVTPPKSASLAHADYLRRAAEQIERPAWRSYLGIQLLEGGLFKRSYSWKDKLRQYVDSFTNLDVLRVNAFLDDMASVQSILAKHGFQTIDFRENSAALENITAWFGVSDDQYGAKRRLQNQELLVPVHGKSIITPKYGELSMYAVRPTENLDFVDPLSNSTDTRWATPLLAPGSDVVCVNIRGQIRSPEVLDNLLDLKGSQKSAASGTRDGQLSFGELVEAGRDSVRRHHLPMLDNVEIIVASKVPSKRVVQTPLEKAFAHSGMDLALLQNRQDVALLSTLPTYPRHVMRIPRGNAKRPHLSNAMMPGFIAFSNLFQSNQPLATSGLFLGLSDDGSSYAPIFVELDAANKYGGNPITLVSGRPGSGKTQLLLQMVAQADFMGASSSYLNPKKTGSLEPTISYLGGVTISMSRQYLLDNPGLADPFLFVNADEEPERIASIISSSLLLSMDAQSDRGSGHSRRRAEISGEILDRCKGVAGFKCGTAREVLLGNEQRGIPPFSDSEVVSFVTNKEKISPFWRSFLAPPNTASALQAKMRTARTLLFEWDDSMDLPSEGKPPSEYSDNERDTMLSLTLMFQYSVMRARASGKPSLVVCDEAHVLKASSEAMAMVDRAGREWRSANINLVLGTQGVTDFVGVDDKDLQGLIGRHLFLAIKDRDEVNLRAFLSLSGFPFEEGHIFDNRHAKYMVNAAPSAGGTKSGSLYRAYLLDSIYEWSGGIILGPWPERELNLGRTDKGADERRRRMGPPITYHERLAGQAASAAARDHSVANADGSFGGRLAEVLMESALRNSTPASPSSPPVGFSDVEEVR